MTVDVNAMKTENPASCATKRPGNAITESEIL